MNINCKITIITVVLNPEKDELKTTINSVVDQEYNDWELIIQDGGTTNNSLSVVPKDVRINIYREKDMGIFDAMNKAIVKATGQYICMLNSGDYFYDSKVFQRVVDASVSHISPVFIYGDVFKPMSRSRYELYPKSLGRYYLYSHMICHQAWFVSRSYYECVGGYDTEEKIGADYRFLVKMILRDNVSYKHVPFLLVYYKGGGVSQNPQLVKKSKKWRDEVRKELFGKKEYYFFAAKKEVILMLKRSLYDTVFFPLWRWLKEKRVLMR